MKDQIIARWSSFSDKDKSILMALAIVILCLLFYTFAIIPVQQGRESLSLTIPDKQGKLLLMKSQAADIERLRGQYKIMRTSADALKSAIEVSAKFHGLTPNYNLSVNGNDNKHLAITLTQISFDGWIKWVESLQSMNHIRVQSCHVTPNGIAGQVKVEAIMTVLE